MSEFTDQLKQFIVSNGLIGIAAGFTIGSVTKDAVSSLVHDIIFPLIFVIINKMNSGKISKLFTDNSQFKLVEFIKQITTWVLIVIFTFIFIEISFIYLLGIDKNLEKKN